MPASAKKQAPPKQPLRGEAAYRASREAIAKRNEAACAAAVRQRAEKETEAAAEILRQDRRDAQAAKQGWSG